MGSTIERWNQIAEKERKAFNTPLECPVCGEVERRYDPVSGGWFIGCCHNCLGKPSYDIGLELASHTWNKRVEEYLREHSEKKEEPHILDSGNRTEFATGAVRDMREGKGRMDLMPLEVVYKLTGDNVIADIKLFIASGDTDSLYKVLNNFARKAYRSCIPTMLLEVGKHFEEGAKKYGENNWQKGIEPKYYIDSAIRHYLKWRRGDKDEPHDRAFVWNIICCIWEVDWHGKEKSDAEKIEENIVAAVKAINSETEKYCHTCKYGLNNATGITCDSCDLFSNWAPKED